MPGHTERGEPVRRFAAAGGDPGVERFRAPPVVHGTERFRQVRWRACREAISIGAFRFVQKRSEKGCGHTRHVAGYDEVPVRRRPGQRGVDAAERTAAGMLVRNQGVGKMTVTIGRPHQSDGARGFSDLDGDVVDQGLATVGKKGFVASHAGALAADQYESGAPHERMISSVLGRDRSGSRIIVYQNITMRSCFQSLAILAVLAGAAAAEPALTARSIVRGDSRSGRLVRSVVVQPKVVPPKVLQPVVVDDRKTADEKRVAAAPPEGAAIQELIDHAAHKYNVDPNLVHAVVKVESGYNPYAISSAGAEGLMQLVPSTARRFGVSNSFDARQNIDAGVRYLKYLQTLYGSNMRLVLAAYNAGEGAVFKYRGIPRYRETENYVYQVGRRWGELNRNRKPAAPKKNEPAPALTNPNSGPRPVEAVVDADGKIHLRSK